jgi:hypothetical protein
MVQRPHAVLVQRSPSSAEAYLPHTIFDFNEVDVMSKLVNLIGLVLSGKVTLLIAGGATERAPSPSIAPCHSKEFPSFRN